MIKHGHNRKGQRTSTYRAWAAAKNRCTNPTNAAFVSYGGRGITICKRWLKFENFLEDMGTRPVGATLDRKKNNRGYWPSNCQWATRKQQARNRRSSRYVTIGGVRRTVAEWCEINGVRLGTAHQRLSQYHWSGRDAVSLPRQK
jgi:hypothetical protein